MTIEPTLQEWAALYQAADEFKKYKAWDWMEDADVFGVVNPETGGTGYCCVMGNLGEVFALAVYEGAEGLGVVAKMYSGEINPGDLEAMVSQKCLMASFESKEALEKPDRDIIKQLGLKYRGADNWPSFRDYQPNLAPWFLNGAQARFLTVALEQASYVAKRFQDDPEYLTSGKRFEDDIPRLDERYLVRVPTTKDGGLEWSDEWRDTEPLPSVPPITVQVDELRLGRLHKTVTRRQGSYECDCFPLASPVQEKKERPFFPYLSVMVDRNLGTPVHQVLAKPDERFHQMTEGLLQFVEESQTIPAEIVVKSQKIADILSPVAKKLKFKVKVASRLTIIEQIQMAMFTMM